MRKELEREFLQLKEENNQYKINKGEIESCIKKTQNDFDNLLNNYAFSKETIEDMKYKISDLEAQVSSLKSILNVKEATITELKQENKKIIDKTNAEIQIHAQNEGQLSSEKENMRTEITTLKSQLKEYKRNIKKAQEEIRNQQLCIERLERENNHIERNYEKQNEENKSPYGTLKLPYELDSVSLRGSRFDKDKIHEVFDNQYCKGTSNKMKLKEMTDMLNQSKKVNEELEVKSLIFLDSLQEDSYKSKRNNVNIKDKLHINKYCKESNNFQFSFRDNNQRSNSLSPRKNLILENLKLMVDHLDKQKEDTKELINSNNYNEVTVIKQSSNKEKFYESVHGKSIKRRRVISKLQDFEQRLNNSLLNIVY